MSAAEVVPPRRSRPVRAWFRLLGSELGLMCGRRRNRVGLGVLFGLVVLVGIALKVSQARHPRGPAGDLMSAVAGNGIFLGFAGLSVEIALFLPLAAWTLASPWPTSSRSEWVPPTVKSRVSRTSTGVKTAASIDSRCDLCPSTRMP